MYVIGPPRHSLAYWLIEAIEQNLATISAYPDAIRQTVLSFKLFPGSVMFSSQMVPAKPWSFLQFTLAQVVCVWVVLVEEVGVCDVASPVLPHVLSVQRSAFHVDAARAARRVQDRWECRLASVLVVAQGVCASYVALRRAALALVQAWDIALTRVRTYRARTTRSLPMWGILQRYSPGLRVIQ